MDWISLVCCLLAFLLYYNTLDAGFVYDDRRAILSNPDLLPSTPWWNLLVNDFWGTPLTDSGSHGSYRPLCVFTFRLNYLLGGFQPWGYHLVNVLLHCLATALVVRVARALLPPAKTTLGSTIAGLTFASHPIHTEAVAGVVGRADLAACNFYLLSFLVYVAHVKYRDAPIHTINISHPPINGCCIQKNTNRINGVSSNKKSYKKSSSRRPATCTNSHNESNNYDKDGLNNGKEPYILTRDKLSYHNILVHLIDNIKKCSWFEDFSTCGAIVCVVKFFLSYGNGWQLKKKPYNTQINDDANRNNCTNGLALVNGCINNGVVYNGSVMNGSAKHVDDIKVCPDGVMFNACPKCNSGCKWLLSWKKHSALVGCVLLAIAATLSKETGITALVACALYDLIRAAQEATWNNKRRIVSLGMLLAALVALLAARIPLSATPKFARADNPTSREPSIVTRFLTFCYLPVFNFLLLVCPSTLSFDWSMDAVPRITTFLDTRNLLSIVFYYGIIKVIWKSAIAVHRHGESKSSSQNRKDAKAHNYSYQKNGTRCLKMNRNSLVHQLNGLCGYTSIVKSGKVMVSGNNMNGKAVCPCPVCRHALTDHHSSSCRAVNNNNSMTQHSTCTCSVTNVRPPVPQEKPRQHFRKSSHSAVLLAASFLTLPFLPATNLFFYVGFVVAERVLYLPSVGFSLLVGLGGARFGAKLGSRARTAALGALLLALSVRTLTRNKDWRDEESLYRSAVGVNPPKAFGNLGSVLSSLGRLQEAEAAFHEALRHRPNMADVHYNLGVLLQGRGQYEEAIQSFERAIHFRPSLALAYVNMGTSLAASGRCSAAGGVLARGARLEGAGVRDSRAHAAARAAALQQLGALHAAQGRPRRALQAYHAAIKAAPPDYHPQKLYVLMSEALSRLQKWAEAEKYRRAALESVPYSSTSPPHGLRPAKGRVKFAEARYRRALLSLVGVFGNSKRTKRDTSWRTEAMLLGDTLKVQSRRIIAMKKELFKEDQIRMYSAFGELDMLISNCRTTAAPKSCCS